MSRINHSDNLVNAALLTNPLRHSAVPGIIQEHDVGLNVVQPNAASIGEAMPRACLAAVLPSENVPFPTLRPKHLRTVSPLVVVGREADRDRLADGSGQYVYLGL